MEYKSLIISFRRVFHWRFFEPGPFPRPGRGEPQLPRLFLDLLARPASWVAAGIWLLYHSQVSPMEGVQSWAGLVSATRQSVRVGLCSFAHTNP